MVVEVTSNILDWTGSMRKTKPFWKRAQKQQPAMVREFAYHDDGTPAFDEEGKPIYRDRPNRAMVRRAYSEIKKDIKDEKADEK